MIAFWLTSHLYPHSPSSSACFGGYGGMARWQVLIWKRLVVNWILEKVFRHFGKKRFKADTFKNCEAILLFTGGKIVAAILC